MTVTPTERNTCFSNMSGIYNFILHYKSCLVLFVLRFVVYNTVISHRNVLQTKETTDNQEIQLE